MILYLDTKKLCKFLADKNPRDYYFVVISDLVSTDQKYDNISYLSNLVPTPSALRKFYTNGIDDDYRGAYLSMINKPDNIMSIAIIINAAINRNLNIVLVNAPREKNLCYMELLADFIESSFKLPVYSWKDYKKDKKIAYLEYTEEQKKFANVVLKKLCKTLKEKEGRNIDVILHPEEYMKMLNKLKKKELRNYCSIHHIPLWGKEHKDKDKMILKIMKRISIC